MLHPGYRPIPIRATMALNCLVDAGVLLHTHCKTKEAMMRERFSGSIIVVAVAVSAAFVSVCIDGTPAQSQGGSTTATPYAPSLKTPWGEPDLQGIWTDEFDTPFQRPAKFASQEYFTEAQREELDKERSSLLSNNERQERGSEVDVAGAYNGVFLSVKRTATAICCWS